MKILKSMRQNSLALGVKLNLLAEQQLLVEMESLEEDLKRFWSKVKKTDNCWEWNGSTKGHGYGQFKLFKRKLKPHRLSYILRFKKCIPNGFFACHSCDNKKCVNPDHLWIGNNSDNQRDASKKGLLPNRNGENCPTSKLKNEDIIEIRRLLKLGVRQRRLSEIYNISPPHIFRIKNNQRWNHI